ncbi:unnamed protein product [Candida verbasci]|uniref:Sister chromatid cohesion protein n=1 Tax=Candida verbasci TaxID=1227364 RepID=A0A9W4TZG8_9ASCO|nr:unnamed protein product [Candida verbasci]
MSIRQQPETLTDLLAVNPLLHLIPKQALIPLLNNPQIGVIADESKFKKQKSQEPINSESMESEIGEELFKEDEYIDGLMTQLKYQKYKKTDQEILVDIKLSTFELKQLEQLNINGEIIPNDDTLANTSRLSVRKKYDNFDSQSHNEKYIKKFNNQLQIYNEQKQETNGIKRANEDENGSTQRKLVKYSEGDLKNFASQFLTELAEYETEKSLTYEESEKVLDVVNKVANKETNVDHLVSVERRCFKSICDFLEKDANINTINDLKTYSNEILGGIYGVRSILTIMNNFPDNKQILVGEYVNIIGKFIEFTINLILNMAGIPNFEIDNDVKLLTTKLSEIGLIFKQLAKLHLKLPLDDAILNKMEMVLIQFIFDEKLNEEKTIIELVPIDAIKISSAYFLIEIARSTNTEQRDFLIIETIMNFNKLSTKRSIFRKFKIDRGFSIQLFTLLLVKLIENSKNKSEAIKLADTVTKTIIEKIDNAHPKTILDHFIDDLFLLLPYPEWSCSETILYSFTQILTNSLSNINEKLNQEIYYLDTLGSIAERVLSFNYDKENLSKDDEREIIAECVHFQSSNALQFLINNYIRFDMKDELKYEKSNPKYLNIILNRLDSFTQSFISNIDKYLKSSKVKVKTKAVKILASLSDKKPDILTSRPIQEILSNRILDDATSVRDAVYEFIGKYIVTHPNEANNFFYPISNALSDDGISVRKKSIKLSKEIYPLLNEQGRITIGSKLLRRLDDEEDSIKNEAIQVMIDIWILEPSPDLISIAMSSSKNLAYLKLFLQFHVLNVENCQTALESLIDLLQDFNEGSLLLLSIISEFKSSLFGQEELIALKQFILDETNISSKSYVYALTILNHCTKDLPPLRPEFITVLDFLLQKSTKLSIKQLHQAIPALWQLCNIFNVQLKLINAVILTMKLIRKAIETNNNDRMMVLLKLLSCFSKYCDLQKYHQEFLNQGFLSMKPNESIISLVVRHILTFLLKDDQYNKKIIAIASASLITACSNNTRMLMAAPVLQIFDKQFKVGDATVVKSLIQSFIEFIKEKDDEIVNRTEAGGFNSSNTTDGVGANLVQRYLDVILKLCLVDKGEYSYLPFQFIELAIEYGYANPKLVVPTILALQASSVNIIQSTAHKIHKSLFMNQKALIESNYQEGIQLAFQYKLEKLDFLNVVYQVINSNKSSRLKFLQAILKSIDISNDFMFNLFIIKRIYFINFRSLEDIYIMLVFFQQLIRSEINDFVEELELKKNQPEIKDLSFSAYLVVDLFKYFTNVYRITSEDIDAYNSKCIDIDFNTSAKQLKACEMNVTWIEENMGNDDIVLKCLKFIKENIN